MTEVVYLFFVDGITMLLFKERYPKVTRRKLEYRFIRKNTELNALFLKFLNLNLLWNTYGCIHHFTFQNHISFQTTNLWFIYCSLQNCLNSILLPYYLRTTTLQIPHFFLYRLYTASIYILHSLLSFPWPYNWHLAGGEQ